MEEGVRQRVCSWAYTPDLQASNSIVCTQCMQVKNKGGREHARWIWVEWSTLGSGQWMGMESSGNACDNLKGSDALHHFTFFSSGFPNRDALLERCHTHLDEQFASAQNEACICVAHPCRRKQHKKAQCVHRNAKEGGVSALSLRGRCAD